MSPFEQGRDELKQNKEASLSRLNWEVTAPLFSPFSHQGFIFTHHPSGVIAIVTLVLHLLAGLSGTLKYTHPLPL